MRSYLQNQANQKNMKKTNEKQEEKTYIKYWNKEVEDGLKEDREAQENVCNFYYF